jgi:hypothetical protein
MRKMLHHSFSAVLLLGFVLYTIPVCTCAEMMKASESNCCSAKAETNPDACCQTPAAAEKMNPEKAFEASKISLENHIIIAYILFAPNFKATRPISAAESASFFSPPSLAQLQVFRI